MSRQGTLKRYALIIDKISNSGSPSFEEIREHLFEYGFEISTRTIQRDIEQIRTEMGLEITYDRQLKGYSIDSSSSINIDSIFRLLDISTMVEIMTDNLKQFRDLMDFISFESSASLRGIENLQTLYSAIRFRRQISFGYASFESEIRREFKINPYLLKEYQSRWYLIGTYADGVDFRTFGLDRMSNLKSTDELFTPLLDADPNHLFSHVIGLTYSSSQIEEIILSVTPQQAKYMKSLPIHSSQKVFFESADEVRISFKLIPNFELKQQILMLGPSVKVLKPSWFADEIKQDLVDTLKKYD
jgi:predicted DNA-binding transcriptional regulator YafY